MPAPHRLEAALAQAVREAILRDAGLMPAKDGKFGPVEHTGAELSSTAGRVRGRPKLTLIDGGCARLDRP
jgi:hypothetical protein